MMNYPLPIGAITKIEWLDNGKIEDGLYVSFGKYEDDQQCDEFGVFDDNIFFYCEDGENELKDLITPDFKVLDYELVFEEA